MTPSREKTCLASFLKGEAPLSWQLVYGSIVLALFFTWLLVGIACYPENSYSIMRNAISNIGNHVLNPRGWIFFSIAAISTAVLMILHVPWIYKNVVPISRGFAMLQSILLGLSIFGFTGVAIVDETRFGLHVFFAVFVFGGLGIDTLLTLGLVIVQSARKKTWPRTVDVNVFFFVILITGSWILFQLATLPPSDSAGRNFVEWIVLFLLLFWLIGYTIMIGRKKML